MAKHPPASGTRCLQRRRHAQGLLGRYLQQQRTPFACRLLYATACQTFFADMCGDRSTESCRLRLPKTGTSGGRSSTSSVRASTTPSNRSRTSPKSSGSTPRMTRRCGHCRRARRRVPGSSVASSCSGRRTARVRKPGRRRAVPSVRPELASLSRFKRLTLTLLQTLRRWPDRLSGLLRSVHSHPPLSAPLPAHSDTSRSPP